MALVIFLFLIGFIFLLKGADVLTDRAASVAKRFGVSNFIIGIVIIGIGTSIPELIVAVFSNLQGAANVGIGTIVGSNTLNILLILGISALISPLILTRRQVWRHMPLNILAVIISAFFVYFSFTGFFGISRLEGLALLALSVFWMFYLYRLSKDGAEDDPKILYKNHSHFSNFIFIILSLAGIIIGGEWVTQGAVALAKFIGLKDSIIGLTIVGLGTSLPELAASAVAAFKKNYGIAVGNIIGSNIFDFLMIFGIAAAMKPIQFTEPLFLDMAVTILSAVLLLGAMFIGKKYVLKRWQGAIFILLYCVYVAYLFTLRP
ncbi:MAG: calcium/sodium antiporter [bacterium]|nr:calcium/sodium antiporter [bacterium]